MQNGLPIRAVYPFDTTVSPWHEIGFTVETCAVSIGLMAIIAMDSTMTTICSLLTVLFDVLSENFENCTSKVEIDVKGQYFIWISAPTNYNIVTHSLSSQTEHKDYYTTNIERDRKEQDSIFLYRYKKCLQFHQRLVSMANTYNRIYNSSMFVQMLSSTSMICLTGFQAVVVRQNNRVHWSDRHRFCIVRNRSGGKVQMLWSSGSIWAQLYLSSCTTVG